MNALNIAIHAVLMAYAIWTVCLRLRQNRAGRDRRLINPDHIKALWVGGAAAMGALLLALVSGKEMFLEVFLIFCIIEACLAVRALEEERRPHARRRKEVGAPTHV